MAVHFDLEFSSVHGSDNVCQRLKLRHSLSNRIKTFSRQKLLSSTHNNNLKWTALLTFRRAFWILKKSRFKTSIKATPLVNSKFGQMQLITFDCVTIHKETADQRTIKSITLRKLRNILNKYKFDTSCYYSKRVIPRERALFLLAKSIFKTMGYLK